MKESLLHVKKIVFWTLAGIGILAIFLYIFESSSFNLTRQGLDYDSLVPSSGIIKNEFRSPLQRFAESPSAKEVATKGGRGLESGKGGEGVLTERKVIKQGSLSLLVKNAEEVANRMASLASRLGGFVSGSQVYEVSAGVKYGTITIRVPASRFDEAMAEVKGMAVKVEREQVSAQDVTEHFVDLEARLKNLRAEELQYLEIMKRAFTVDDILKVTSHLTNVRGQIEQIQGQLQYLSRQVDMTTITANLSAEADVEVFGIRWRPLFVAKQAFRGMLEGLSDYIDAMIYFLFRLPVWVLWFATLGVGVWIGWRIIRWVRAKFIQPSGLS